MPSELNPITRITSLGDQAVLVYLKNEVTALGFAAAARRTNPVWMIDVVQAYTSVAIFYDVDQVGFATVATRVEELGDSLVDGSTPQETPLHIIPCCYEFQLDMARVAEHTGLAPVEIIRLHAETEFTVYAIGFCPGFPYLGYLPEPLGGVPRLPEPRLRVEPGSVGLTGRQTGIYTEAKPGGWNIIGRTPLELVHVADRYFPLRTGHRIRFQPINEAEYAKLRGQRL